MTVVEFMTERARCWYNNYKHSPNFKSISDSHKEDALIRYLSPTQCYSFKASQFNVKPILNQIKEKEKKDGGEGEKDEGGCHE